MAAKYTTCTTCFNVIKLYFVQWMCLCVSYDSHKKQHNLPQQHEPIDLRMEVQCAFCAVRIEVLNIFETSFMIQITMAQNTKFVNVY
jgi:hypothetical protein